MTDTTMAPTEAEAAPVPGCTCCKPPAPPSVDEQVAELRRRQETVERRLQDLRAQ